MQMYKCGLKYFALNSFYRNTSISLYPHIIKVRVCVYTGKQIDREFKECICMQFLIFKSAYIDKMDKENGMLVYVKSVMLFIHVLNLISEESRIAFPGVFTTFLSNVIDTKCYIQITIQNICRKQNEIIHVNRH